jgi:hypothetical protein
VVIESSVDGTGQFSSSNISCKDCCSKIVRNSKKQYYHQLLGAVMVHPDKASILPFFPEAIHYPPRWESQK